MTDAQAAPEAHDVDEAIRMHRGTVGMVLFLMALSMLFIAGLLGYVLIRTSGGDKPDLHTLALPVGLWFSTACIVVSGVTMEWARQSVKSGQIATFKRAMLTTLLLALAFVAIQTPSLIALLAQHRSSSESAGTKLYGLIFVLILLHALHVIGGLIPMCVTTAKAFRGAYDQNHWIPVRLTAMYWHFLDVVWVVTFSLFLAVG